MKENKPRIVIWGADNYNTLGMLRSLGKEDFDILLLINGRRHGVASASKYCQKYHETRNVEEAVEYLINNYLPQSDPLKRAVLMPGGDDYSIGTALNYDRLKSRFHLMCTSDPEVLLKVTDKNVMGEIAQESGILVPPSSLITKDNLNHTIPYPVILKHVHTEGPVEFKTRIIKSEQELKAFSKFWNPKNTYLVQQYINKSHDIYMYGCRLNDGEVILAGINNQYRWSDDGGGSFGDLSPEIPDYIDRKALERFFEKIDYHGLFSSEYGFCDGKAYFYEVNLRNDGFTHLSLQAGANLPLLWVSDCLKLNLKASPVMTKNMKSFNEIYDIINVFKGHISYRQYKRDKASAGAFNFYDPEDPQPFKNMKKRQWWEIPVRAVYKILRPQIVWVMSKLKG